MDLNEFLDKFNEKAKEVCDSDKLKNERDAALLGLYEMKCRSDPTLMKGIDILVEEYVNSKQFNAFIESFVKEIVISVTSAIMLGFHNNKGEDE